MIIVKSRTLWYRSLACKCELEQTEGAASTVARDSARLNLPNDTRSGQRTRAEPPVLDVRGDRVRRVPQLVASNEPRWLVSMICRATLHTPGEQIIHYS